MREYFGMGLIGYFHILVEIYIALLLLRFLLECFSGKLYNPIYRFIYTVTQPPVGMLQKIFRVSERFNWPCLLLMLILELFVLTVFVYFTMAHLPNFSGLLIWSVADLLHLTKLIFVWSIIIYAILTWITTAHHAYNPLQELTGILIEPLLRPLQRVLPTIAGFDVSPIIALIMLEIVSFIVVVPLMSLGQGLAL